MTLLAKNRIAFRVSVERLQEAVDYNSETGEFRWRERPEEHFDSYAKYARWNGKYAGKPAFTSADPRGYYRGCLDGCFLYAHRAAVAIDSGEWPRDEVDHRNRDKGDNRISNLRVVTHSENRMNTENYERANNLPAGSMAL